MVYIHHRHLLSVIVSVLENSHVRSLIILVVK